MSTAITTLLDWGSVGVILLGILAFLLTEPLSSRLSRFRAIQISTVAVCVSSLGVSSVLLDVEEMRVVVAVFLLSFLVPLTIVFLIVWLLSSKSTTTRVQYISFVSWITTLTTAVALRIPLGWGTFDSVVANLGLALLLSLVNGLFGAVVGMYLMKNTELYKED